MHTYLSRRPQGFSLIELMISMLIGLIVLGGVLTIVINSKRSFLDHQAMSQIQENARYALDTITRDIRMAGYFACAPTEKGVINTSKVGGTGGYLIKPGDAIAPLTGFDNVTNAKVSDAITSVALATDVIMIRRADVEKEYRVVNTPVTTKELTVAGAKADVVSGDPMVLVAPGCDAGILFNAGDVSGTTIKGLPSGVPLKSFVAGSRVAPVLVNSYYVSTSTLVTDSPVLKREIITATGSTFEELAIGVENLQFEYGTLVGGVMTYSSAVSAASVADAVAVRVHLLMRSQMPVHNTPLGFTFRHGDTAADKTEIPADRYLRQQVSATVQLRNRG